MKVSINLLPAEFRELDLKNKQFLKIQTIGFLVIMAMVLLSSAVVALRVLQSQNISNLQTQIKQSEQKISTLKNTQASLVILKDRLSAINQYLGVSSNQTQLYKIVTKLLPAEVSVTTIAVDKNGDVYILLTTSNGSLLDEIITSLTAKESNEGKVSQVSLENLSRGKDGIYRVSLRVKSKTHER